MSGREVTLSSLIGRRVRDADGVLVGRMEELCAEIELHRHGTDYVVREFHLGAFGWLEALAGAHVARALIRRLGAWGRYRRYVVPWDLMDLGDPANPRLRVRRAELRSG